MLNLKHVFLPASVARKAISIVLAITITDNRQIFKLVAFKEGIMGRAGNLIFVLLIFILAILHVRGKK